MIYLPVLRLLPWCYAGLFLLSTGAISMNAKAGTASQTFRFSAIFVAPTCTMKIPSVINFTPTGEGVQSSELIGEGLEATGGVTISFSDCMNYGMTRPPQIQVTGRTVQLGGSDFYFADAPEPAGAYPANGYGVKLSLNGQKLFEDSANIAVTEGGGVIKAKTGSTIEALNGSSLNLNARLSCGSYSPCSRAPDHQTGAFKATIRFQLAYD